MTEFLLGFISGAVIVLILIFPRKFMKLIKDAKKYYKSQLQ